MSDDPAKRGKPDRDRINVNQRHELRYWRRALYTNGSDLKFIVREAKFADGKRVGVMVADVKRYMIERIQKA